MKTIDAVELLIDSLRHLVPARVLFAGPTLCRAREQQKNTPSSSAQRSKTRRAAGVARCAAAVAEGATTLAHLRGALLRETMSGKIH
eukprot:5623674-Pleurochrysis_carterae.AAC.1